VIGTGCVALTAPQPAVQSSGGKRYQSQTFRQDGVIFVTARNWGRNIIFTLGSDTPHMSPLLSFFQVFGTTLGEGIVSGKLQVAR